MLNVRQLWTLYNLIASDGDFCIDRDKVYSWIGSVATDKENLVEHYPQWLLKYNYYGSEQEEVVNTSVYDVVAAKADDALSYDGTDEVTVFRRYATIVKPKKRLLKDEKVH